MGLFTEPHDYRPGKRQCRVWVCVAIIAMAVVGTIAGVRQAVESFQTARCDRIAEGLHTEGDWGFYTSCRVKTVDGRWVDAENYKITDEEPG